MDDVPDIAVMEQVITFIQFYNEDSGKITVQVLSVDNLLETHDSANAMAMFQTIQCNLQACSLSIVKLIGLATDGASVMVERKNALAAKLKDVNPYGGPQVHTEFQKVTPNSNNSHRIQISHTEFK